MIRPIEAQGLRPLDLGAMVASAVLILPLMWRGWVLNRWEGASCSWATSPTSTPSSLDRERPATL